MLHPRSRSASATTSQWVASAFVLIQDRLTTPGGLVLRRWTPDDVDAVLEAFAAPDMAGQASAPTTTRAAARAWIAGTAAAWERGDGFVRAVSDEAEQVLASIAVTAVERRHDTGWVSYFTLPASRGRGVAAEGLRTTAAWALGDLGLHRLELGHRTNNPASCRVATAAGFAVEGLEREKLRYGDQRFDVELHARLAGYPVPAERRSGR